MKTIWKLDKNGQVPDTDSLNEQDMLCLKLVLSTIKEAEAQLVVNSEESNAFISISLRADSIVIVEKQAGEEDSTAIWVPYITYAIGAVHDCMKDMKSIVAHGVGNGELELKDTEETEQMEEDCIRWLVYEHSHCMSNVINGGLDK